MGTSARAELRSALRQLEIQAQAARKAADKPCSRREAAKQAGLRGQRISDWLNDDPAKAPAPQDWDRVWALIRTWCTWAGRVPEKEKSYWDRLWQAASQEVPFVAPDPHLEPSTAPAPVGQLISEVDDPLAFEVHRSIDADPGRGTTSPALSTYVDRVHDRLLGEAVARVAAGTSELVTLVGGSSTGKTRACWEALHRLPAGWRVWHPLRPDRPEAFLEELPGLGPATVVWLNEAQHYLQPTRDRIGEKVAAELRNVLRAPGRGPVLVLATLWPQFWEELTRKGGPPTEEDRVHAQTRDLLERGTRIPVSDAFTSQDLVAARGLQTHDPRLVQALGHAEQGHITQYLAGGPALIERYETAPPAAKAMIETAMDARRLGHSLGLPLAFLQAAAPAYLTDLQWDSLREDWLEQALAYVTEPCRGARGPLTRIRPRPRPGDPEPARPLYRLADYLQQRGLAQRYHAKVPWGFWDAAIAHANPGDQETLGSAARTRGLLRLAFHLYTRATTHAGARSALWQAAEMLQEAGRMDEAGTWYQRAAEAGNPRAFGPVAGMLRGAGRMDEAITWYQRAAETGDASALWSAVETLQEAGRIDEAITWLQSRAEAGDTFALRQAARMLQAAGRIDEAITWLRDRGEAGSPRAFGLAAGMLQAAGRIDEAITWYQRAAEAGDTSALWSVARMLREAGRIDEAITWYQRAVETTDTANPSAVLRANSFLTQLVGDLERAGRIDEAITWLQSRAEAGDTSFLWLAAAVLRRAGRIDEAVTWDQRAAEARNGRARMQASSTIRQAPFRPARPASATAGVNVRPADKDQAAWLQEAGRIDEAITWLQDCAEAGHGSVVWHMRAAGMLHEAGRIDEANRLRQFGWEPGGRFAPRWNAVPVTTSRREGTQ